MADLSSVINFSVALDKNTGYTKVTDTSSYASGVASGITGIVSITQPDGITRSGNWLAPDIYWDGSQLVIANLELRLAEDGLFQNGSYSITYTIRHSSYDETSITRTFTLSYSRPSILITESFDIFTPLLKVIDSTTYEKSGFALQSVTRLWEALIQTVSGTIRSKVGSTQEFDLSYGGDYYDAYYDISLDVIVTYRLSSATWVSVIDRLNDALEDETALQAQIPPTIDQFLAMIKGFKNELDALVTNCTQYDIKLQRYKLITSVFDQLVKNGQSGLLSGLKDYVLELQLLLNDGVTPTYTNTNAIIPTYDWGVGAGSVAWGDVSGKPSSEDVYFEAGDFGYPAVGSSTYTNSSFENTRLIVFKNRLLLPPGNVDGGDYYEKPLASGTMTFYPALAAEDKIYIFKVAL